MRRCLRAHGSAFVIALILCLVVLGCDSDSPTRSEPVADYIFYFNNGAYDDRYHRYSSATGRVDALLIPYQSWYGFAVSADGEQLYLSDRDRVTVVSTDSLDSLGTLPYPGRDIAVSPNGRNIAICGEDLFILDIPGYSVVHHDTDKVAHGVFSHDGESFFAAGGWYNDSPQMPYVYEVDLEDSSFTTTRTAFPDGGVWRVVPTVDCMKWIMLLRRGQFDFVLAVYDLQRDSITFREELSPGSGEIELTPDGRYAFYTNPGTILFGPPAWEVVSVLDISENTVVARIATPSPVNGYMIPKNLAISPDGRILVAGGAPGQGEFSVIDVRRLKVVEHHYVGNQADIWDVTCQNSL